MSEADEAREALKQRFPEMQPLRHAPSMSTINGIGTGIYGRRDYDPETRSYVKTQCFCFAFIPLVALGAYRVIDAGSGSWYFLGRVPLSPLARGWNYLVLGLILLLGGGLAVSAAVDSYHQSPNYVQGQALAHAREIESNGDYGGAAQEFARVAQSRTSSSAAAAAELQDVLDHHFQDQPGPVAVNILAAGNNLSHDLQTPTGGALLTTGVAYIQGNLGTRPRDSELVRNWLVKNCGNHAPLDPLEKPILEALMAAEPNNPQPVSDLAQVYEREQDAKAWEALLTAHKDHLGETEAARMLGQLYYDRGEMEAAYPLLEQYAGGRLKHLQTAEEEFRTAGDRAWKSHIAELNRGDASDAWYRQYDALKDDAAKDKLVSEWVANKLTTDKAYQAKLAALKEAAKIVPVALDLGIARLAHAHSLTDPAKRKVELEEIEKLFLNMEGVAGETDEYHLFYGQVCYWLGKRDEGRKQFDDLLANNDRSAEVLYSVSQKLREVGETEEARKLGEEAFNAATNGELKKSIAEYMALVVTSTEDQTAWLAKADQAAPWVAVQAAWLEVQKAREQHDRAALITNCNKLLAMAEKDPKSASQLNIRGLTLHVLFHATGEVSKLTTATELLAEAVALEPKDSILLSNYVSMLGTTVCQQAWGGEIQYHQLYARPSYTDGSWFNDNQAESEQLAAKVRQQPAYATTVKALQRLLTLAPADNNNWQLLQALYYLAEDEEGLRDLLSRRKSLPASTAADWQGIKDRLAGVDAEDTLKDRQPITEFFNALVTGPAAKFESKTQAMAIYHWANMALDDYALGAPLDPDLLVQRATVCRQQRPCHASRWLERQAYAYRCLCTLGKQQPAAAEFQKKYRVLTVEQQLALLIATDPAARVLALEDADFKQFAANLQKNREAFPRSAGTVDWLVFRATNPELAAKVATNLTHEERILVARDLDSWISPMSMENAIEICVVDLIAEQPEAAQKHWQTFVDRGLPLPPLPWTR